MFSTIRQVEWDLPEAAWAEALAECPDATYFHTAGWLRAMRVAFGSTPMRVRVHLDGGRWALLPLSVRPLAKGLVPVALSGETGVYGGWVAPLPLSPEEATQAYRVVRARYRDLHLTGNPFAQGTHLPAASGAPDAAHFTHVLALAPFEQLRAGFSRGGKARGNKARKQGYSLVVSQDPADAAVFYRLYLDSVRRWGEKLTWPRELGFFEAVLRESAPQASLLIAMHEGQAVSALLMAAYGGVAHYLAGATDAEAMAGAPSNFLMEAALAHYHQQGCAWFDFGSSNGLAGVVQFKESFGAQPVPYAATRLMSLRGQLYFTLRQAREARRMPPRAAAAEPAVGLEADA